MFSTPAPIPISITPDLILLATILTASSPLEHYLLTAKQHVVSGYPPKNAVILAYNSPAPDIKVFPITIS